MPITIGTAGSKLGQILVDSAGRTLYLFEIDQATVSSCYDACAQEWPPVLTTGEPQPGAGVMPGLLGTTKRTDGTTEVSYNGHPLYYFVRDTQSGDASGEGVNDNGGLWFAISPGGTAIEPPVAASTPAPAAGTQAPLPPPPALPPPSGNAVSFAGLPQGVYPVHIHSACNGSQNFHIAVLQSLAVGPNGSGSIAVPAGDFGRGSCVIVYTNASLRAVLTARTI
jgi:predicted lipoprotein with Yx(FWY)xxD motif